MFEVDGWRLCVEKERREHSTVDPTLPNSKPTRKSRFYPIHTHVKGAYFTLYDSVSMTSHAGVRKSDHTPGSIYYVVRLGAVSWATIRGARLPFSNRNHTFWARTSYCTRRWAAAMQVGRYCTVGAAHRHIVGTIVRSERLGSVGDVGCLICI
jgi:hypothetical protein